MTVAVVRELAANKKDGSASGRTCSGVGPVKVVSVGGLRVQHYQPVGCCRGLAVLAPGSRGGMGPGQTKQTIGRFSSSIRSIYSTLGRQLSHRGIAVCHFSWRRNPTRPGATKGTLKSLRTLQDGAVDVRDAARYLRKTYGRALSLVLIGFSYGGPSVMAAAALSLSGDVASSLGPLGAVLTLATGQRIEGEDGVSYSGLDSVSCVVALARHNVPLLMVHGLADVTVDPSSSATIFAGAPGPKAAVWMHGADHQMRARFDDVMNTLLQWLSCAFEATISAGIEDETQMIQKAVGDEVSRGKPTRSGSGSCAIHAASHGADGVTTASLTRAHIGAEALVL